MQISLQSPVICSNTVHCIVNLYQVRPARPVKLERLEQPDQRVLMALWEKLDSLVLLVNKEHKDGLDRGD